MNSHDPRVLVAAHLLGPSGRRPLSAAGVAATPAALRDRGAGRQGHQQVLGQLGSGGRAPAVTWNDLDGYWMRDLRGMAVYGSIWQYMAVLIYCKDVDGHQVIWGERI